MDREDEIWFIHDYELYVDSEEEYEEYLQILNRLLVQGHSPPRLMEVVEEWLELTEADIDPRFSDFIERD